MLLSIFSWCRLTSRKSSVFYADRMKWAPRRTFLSVCALSSFCWASPQNVLSAFPWWLLLYHEKVSPCSLLRPLLFTQVFTVGSQSLWKFSSPFVPSIPQLKFFFCSVLSEFLSDVSLTLNPASSQSTDKACHKLAGCLSHLSPYFS